MDPHASSHSTCRTIIHCNHRGVDADTRQYSHWTRCRRQFNAEPDSCGNSSIEDRFGLRLARTIPRRQTRDTPGGVEPYSHSWDPGAISGSASWQGLGVWTPWSGRNWQTPIRIPLNHIAATRLHTQVPSGHCCRIELTIENLSTHSFFSLPPSSHLMVRILSAGSHRWVWSVWSAPRRTSLGHNESTSSVQAHLTPGRTSCALGHHGTQARRRGHTRASGRAAVALRGGKDGIALAPRMIDEKAAELRRNSPK